MWANGLSSTASRTSSTPSPWPRCSVEHVDVGEIRQRVPVRERPCEADLLVAVVEADDPRRRHGRGLRRRCADGLPPSTTPRRDTGGRRRGRCARRRRRARSRPAALASSAESRRPPLATTAWRNGKAAETAACAGRAPSRPPRRRRAVPSSASSDHPLLEQLAACRLEIVGEHRDRLRRRLHLWPGICREALRPASELLDLPVIHMSHLHRRTGQVQPGFAMKSR